MKIIENTKLIARNKKISKYSSFSALALLALGFYFTLKEDAASMIYSLFALLFGLVLWQISMYYTSRWGAKVCPHELITSALKGLDDKYTLYHYSTPVSHLLASPSGLWIIHPVITGGKITYTKGKWKQTGGSKLLRFFAQDSIGRPDAESQLEINDLLRAFSKKDIKIDPDSIKPIIVFFNKKVELSVEDSPIACIQYDKVKDYIRKQAKSSTLSPAILDKLLSIFDTRGK